MPFCCTLPHSIIEALETLVSESAATCVFRRELIDCGGDIVEDLEKGFDNGGNGNLGGVGFIEDGVVEIGSEGEE